MISESEVILSVHRAAHATLHALGAALADLGLTDAEINALGVLAERAPCSVTEISRRTGTKSSTVTGVLDRLERRGYLTRAVDPDDRRSFRITLTTAGRAAAFHVRDAVAALERRALANVDPGQLDGFTAVITALQEAGHA